MTNGQPRLECFVFSSREERKQTCCCLPQRWLNRPMRMEIGMATQANRGLKIDRSTPNCHDPGFSLIERPMPSRCHCAFSRLISCPKCPDRTSGGRGRCRIRGRRYVPEMYLRLCSGRVPCMIFRDSGAETTAKSLKFEEAKRATARSSTHQKKRRFVSSTCVSWLSDR